MKTVYDLTESEMKDLYLEEGKEDLLFEGDPDYIIFENDEMYLFTDYNGEIITSSELWDSQKEMLEGFFNNDEHWIPLENQTRDAFEECKNPKIAYRGGVGYIYHLYEYNN